MLVHFDCGTVQHKGCLIDYILPDQICQYVLPYACLCPCTKSTVHTLPGAKPFGQIPPGNTCIQPVYHCIEHFPVVFAWTAALRLSFWWKQVFYSFPLRFTQFMSFHVLKFTTLAFCTQALGFKTGSRRVVRKRLMMDMGITAVSYVVSYIVSVKLFLSFSLQPL